MRHGLVIDGDPGWEKDSSNSDERRSESTSGEDWAWALACRLLHAAVRLLIWLLVLVGGFTIGNPYLAVGLVLAAGPAVLSAHWLGILSTVLVAAAFTAWWWRSPETFDIRVGSRWRAWRRRRRYSSEWPDVMVGANLRAYDRHKRVVVPEVRSVGSGRFADVLCVGLPHGITTETFAENLDVIAEAFRAREARIVPRPTRRRAFLDRLPELAPGSREPGRVWLRLSYGDRLARTLQLPNTAAMAATAANVDFHAVPVGHCDDGTVWTVRLLGTHVLLAGATGSGKGSVLWSIVASLAPAIRDGVVRLVGIDPKGGMELGFGRELFHRLLTMDAPGAEKDAVEFLEDLANEADRRAARLAGKARVLEPSTAMPFLVIVLDELASLTAHISESKLRNRSEAALGRLLTKGRAPGMCVIGALQDPRKDIVKYRELFPTRIALRLIEAGQVDMVLGDGAHARGAHCEQIPEASPGVGYVAEDGKAAVTRVRAAYVTDDDIRHLAHIYRPGQVGLHVVDMDKKGKAA
jgi:S-DNA-T family DNA segregation ATPase FtsK/SpoIIIE